MVVWLGIDFLRCCDLFGDHEAIKIKPRMLIPQISTAKNVKSSHSNQLLIPTRIYRHSTSESVKALRHHQQPGKQTLHITQIKSYKQTQNRLNTEPHIRTQSPETQTPKLLWEPLYKGASKLILNPTPRNPDGRAAVT